MHEVNEGKCNSKSLWLLCMYAFLSSQGNNEISRVLTSLKLGPKAQMDSMRLCL